MGIERSYSPEHFRRRAEQFRAKAESCGHGETRDVLLKAAARFDELARRAEKIRGLQELQQ